MRKGVAVLALVSFALFDCATLTPLSDGACGNGVIDANEDCDGFAPAGIATGKCGAPSEGASACRLQCASAADCPDGWGCAAAGICREPSGRFGSIGEGVSAGVETMVVGDFDGDRRKDVLGSGPQSATSTAKVRVHYFGDDAQLAQVNTLGAPISSPTVRDLNNDGVDDFAFGLDVGALGVITGQPDRSLVPAVFPSFRFSGADAKPALIRAASRRLPGGVDLSFFFAGTFKRPMGGTANLLTSADDGYVRELPVAVDGLIGEPVWGRFFTDASSTCGEVALAMKSGTNGAIHVFAPCRPKVGDSLASEWAPLRAPVVITPPGPLEGIQVIDENGDGHSDLLFIVRKENGRAVYLARGSTAGFEDPVPTDLLELPLASGDFDRDGKVDFVLPSLIALSSRPGTAVGDAGGADGGAGGTTPFRGYFARFSDRRVRWTSAKVGFFNGDDLLDVVAASSDQPDLDFFGSTREGVFVQSSISTSGPVSRLTVGDFDGDKLVDVGFVQKRAGAGDAFDVSIAYSQTNGPPEPARVVGRTEEAISLEAFANASQGEQGLALFFRKPGAAGELPDLAFALIIGNGDRQPVAPLLLDDELSRRRESDPDIQREWVPLEVHASNVADANRIDLIALAVGYRFSRSLNQLAPGTFPSAVWVAEGTGGTAFDAPKQVADLAGFDPTGAGSTILFEARTAVGDIDTPKDGKADVVVFQRLAEKNALALFIARPDSSSAPVEIPGERVRRDAPFTLADIDADGNLDAVILLGERDAQKVVVFFNDAKGGFVVPGVTVPTAEGESTAGFAHVLTTGASFDGKRKAKRELAVVTNKRIVFAAPDPSDRSRLVTRDVVPEGGAPLVGPTAIAQGDFDGDGVDDLAIADSGALRILRQLPVRR